MKVRSLRSAAALFLAVILTLPTVFAAAAGEQVWQTQSVLADGLTYTDTVSLHPSYGREELYSLTLAPGGEVKPIVLTGDSTVYGGATISGMVSRAKALGYHVLGAVNADFFSLTTRVPMGIVVENGVYKSSPEGENAIAFRADGSAFLSTPEITLTLTNQGGNFFTYNGGQTITLTHLNKTRSGAGLYLYNESFSTVSTRTAEPGWMARLKVVEGELTLDSTVTLEVEDVFHTDGETYPHAQSIGEGYYLLTAADTAGKDAEFAKLAVGDRVTLSASCSDEAMSQAVWACGSGDILVQDGAVTDSSTWDSAISTARHPRTLLGIRQDGAVQLTVADGRKTSHSNGLTLTMAAEELLSQGCTTVINLDGGGSSALAVQTPGNSGSVVVNQPSDGSQRRCATYILFVSTQPAVQTPARLYLSQDGAVVFAGSSLDLSGYFAADTAAYQTEAPADVTLSVAGDHGTLDGTVYTAVSPGVETVTLTSPSTGASGTARIYVVDALSTLTVTQGESSAEVTTLSPQPGEEIQLNVTGTWNGFPVALDRGCALWSADGSAGTVTEDGLFTASRFSQADGTVSVTCGGVTKSVSLTLPVSFLDTDSSWAKDFILNLANQGIVGGVNTDEGTMYYPNRNITRQEFFVMLCNIQKIDPAAYADTELPFADAEQIPAWSLNYVKAMYALGYTSGALGTDGKLYSNYGKDITRAEIAVLMSQFLTPNEDFQPTSFTDQAQIPTWALPGMLNAVSNGLMGGYPDGTIRSGNSATRAEVAAILSNFQTCLTNQQAEDLPAGES